MNEPFFCLKAISSQLSGSAAIDLNEWNRYGCGKPFFETRLNGVNGDYYREHGVNGIGAQSQRISSTRFSGNFS